MVQYKGACWQLFSITIFFTFFFLRTLHDRHNIWYTLSKHLHFISPTHCTKMIVGHVISSDQSMQQTLHSAVNWWNDYDTTASLNRMSTSSSINCKQLSSIILISASIISAVPWFIHKSWYFNPQRHANKNWEIDKHIQGKQMVFKVYLHLHIYTDSQLPEKVKCVIQY